MSLDTKEESKLLEKIVEALELPTSAYEKAEARYQDLGEWFGRDQSSVNQFSPHIFPQGSFRLGTAIRPLDEKEEYDLDLACKLTSGTSKKLQTQEQIKILVGEETEAYRKARGMHAPIEEKHRCWRLEYQDDLSFHMDIVPCITASAVEQDAVFDKMILAESQEVSKSSSQNAVSITDDRLPNYRDISDHWLISNPEGYAKWFENRMRSSGTQVVLNKAQVDNVPLFNMKTPLQRVIQILKRHRDQMFENNDESKPISIIISTLAARSYEGELDLKAALEGILNRMDRYISSRTPRVANPVNPGEDFADRWAMPQYANLELEQNFRNWLKQARADFQILFTHRDRDFIGSQLKIKMGITLGAVTFDEILLSVPVIPYSPKIHLIESDSPKPWRSNID